MKQKLKDGYEVDLLSQARKDLILTHKAGVWKTIKKRLNKRSRKEGKLAIDR